jgi:hypothetical protein
MLVERGCRSSELGITAWTSWLQGLGLERYVPAFRDNEIPDPEGDPGQAQTRADLRAPATAQDVCATTSNCRQKAVMRSRSGSGSS